MSFVFKDKKIIKLIAAICDEHHKVSREEDSNIGYLWFMYAKDGLNCSYRPFMFLAEISLLKSMGYLTADEKESMVKMLESKDEDNHYLIALSIQTLRDKRIKDHGLYKKDNPAYKNIIYIKDVIDTNLFLKSRRLGEMEL